MIYLNDNFDPFVPGAVDSFPGEAELFAYVEPWIAKEPHLVFNDDGVCFRIEADRAGRKSLRELGVTLSPEDRMRFIAQSHPAEA